MKRVSCLFLELLEPRCMPSTVTNLTDHDPGSLRDAIATTPDGGTVDFQPGLTGTITLTTGELAISKDLTINGAGADMITVSGNKASRVFNIADITVAISGLTIADGKVTNVDGGGISNAGTLTIADCTFTGDSATSLDRMGGQGGGIWNNGKMTVTGVALTGNSAAFFGGGISSWGTATVTASSLSGNSATWGGGAIFNGGGTLTVTASLFSGNSTSFQGGGMLNNGTLTVTGSTFRGNSATALPNGFDGAGGGIYNNTMLTVTASTFGGNSAYVLGGGIENFGGRLTVTDSTFSRNSAKSGGGIYNGGKLTMRNTLLAGNKAQSGDPDVEGPLTSLGHNLIGGDPKLGPLQDNGGPTWTMAVLPGSPAIDAGGPTDSEWDQRGPGYPRSVNGMTDIGAYEVQPSGAGAAALALHSADPTHHVPVMALSDPSKLSIPLRPAAADVDRVFSSDALGSVAGRPKHAAGTEPLCWAFDPLPA
jgi:predicted outer membrane repeat protein